MGKEEADNDTPYAIIADDDVLIRMDAADILQDAGFRVHEACNVEDAIALLEQVADHVQLLFTDVQMPPSTLTGFDLARRCAKDWPYVKILVASGQIKPKIGDMPDGAVFVGKPFSADVIYDRLQELLPDGEQPEPIKRSRNRGD
mgnify:CR=1 FL=1